MFGQAKIYVSILQRGNEATSEVKGGEGEEEGQNEALVGSDTMCACVCTGWHP